MSEEKNERDFMKACFNAVAGLEVKNESQAIAKEVILDEVENLTKENKQLKEVIDKVTKELFILKDMIYKPETREENFEIQRKISSIIKRLNGKEVSK